MEDETMQRGANLASELSSLDAKDLGDEFISELNKLSIKERDEAINDLHGVGSVSKEDPDCVRSSLDSFARELNSIPDNEKQDYLLALKQSHEYVTNEDFLIMFLRASYLNPKAAAARYVAFYQIKRELFGEEKLGRDIRVDDLSEEDMVCLESGFVQILNARDRADRAIFFLVPMGGKFDHDDINLRVWYVVMMFALKDVETQKNGMVMVAYNHGKWKTTNRTAVFRSGQLASSLPIKFAGVHYCFDDEKMKGLFYLAMYAVQKTARLRVRFHLGTDMEIIYTLMTFGMSNSAIPIGFNGSLRLEAHKEYVQTMKMADQITDDVDRIYLPLKYDVLLGRGKPLQKYSGNLNYHYIVESYHERYEEAAKGVKSELAMEIVKTIQAQGGRFLKRGTVGWTMITDEAARSKVSHTFRNHRIAARSAIKKAMELTKTNPKHDMDGMAKGSPHPITAAATERNRKKLRLEALES